MYKCSECGSEYEIKPDFCECGNDVFEEVKEQIPELQKQNEILQKESIPAPKKAESFNSTAFVNQKIRKFTTDPVSAGIFVICLIISFAVLFIWNPEVKDSPNNTSQVKSKREQIKTNIPSVDKIWNNTLPVQEVKKEEQKIVVIPQTTVPKQNTTAKKVNKPVSNTKTQKQTSKPVQQTQKVTAKQQEKPKTSNSVQKAKSVQQKPVPNQQSQTQQTPTVQKPAVTKPVKKQEQKLNPVISAQEKQEYINYTVNLRNTIGRKIDFTKVIGDGNCIVAFQINSEGKLINRSFAKQSSNITLNDAVYAAVMSTPRYNPPPSAYNNEVLKLNIKFQNGNFEISIN